MKASNHSRGLDVSLHRFLSMISTTIATKINIDLAMGGKVVSDHKINVLLTGQIENEQGKERVRHVMQELQNPITLIDQLRDQHADS